MDGNITVKLQVMVDVTQNKIGEDIPIYEDVMELTGYIDYLSGEARASSFNARIMESTHVFVGEYKPIPETFSYKGKEVRVTDENTKVVANLKEYLVKLIDDPMDLHDHIEIYMDYTGG